MLSCWEIKPENRRNFKSLASDLVESLVSMADYLIKGGVEGPAGTANAVPLFFNGTALPDHNFGRLHSA